MVYGIDEAWLRRVKDYLRSGLGAYLREMGGGDKNAAVIIQAHPFRHGMTREPGTDGAEVFNMHPYHDSRNDSAVDYAREHGLIMTAGSDFHNEGAQGSGLILSKVLPADSYGLAGLLRSGDYLFWLEGEVIAPDEVNKKHKISYKKGKFVRK